MKHQQTNGFTLLELLAVIVILGIIVAFSIPAMTSLMKANSMSSATRQVANSMSLARQYAITQRSKTRVVFPSRVVSPGDNPLSTSMWYTAYAILLCTNTQNSADWKSWKYLSQWEYLPEGTIFKWSFAPTTCFIPNATNSVMSNKVRYVEFTSTGAYNDNRILIHRTTTIREGYVDPLGGTQVFNSAGANYADIVGDYLTGRIQVIRP